MGAESRLWPDIAIGPGELLAETLDDLGLSQAELARRAGRPPQVVNEIIRGTKEITPETALQLERVLAIPAHVWIRMEADYRFNLARLQDLRRLKSEIPEAVKYPYAAMAKLGWVAVTRDPLERVMELLKFFGVNSLAQVTISETANYRKSRERPASSEALAAWLRQGERKAQNISTESFDENALREYLAEVRSLTKRLEFVESLTQGLSQCGVALALVPHLPRTYAQGATRWLGARAVVQMSIRYKWDDIFWFSLFHELGHVLLHGRNRMFIEYVDNGKDNDLEREADRFACKHLISEIAYEQFITEENFSRKAVLDFARSQEIAPSIVVGRLQHEEYIYHSQLNDLRSRFEWASGQ